MSTDNIIRLAILGAYTIYLIIYSILTALWYKREQKNRKSKRYIQDQILADMIESGFDIPKDKLIKYLRGDEEVMPAKTEPNKKEKRLADKLMRKEAKKAAKLAKKEAKKKAKIAKLEAKIKETK